MSSFLNLVARHLVDTYGQNMGNLCIVFPGQRAKLFLAPLLSQMGGVLWAPSYTDMSNLMQRFSPYRLIDPVEAVCLLHSVYARHVQDAEPLDDFFTWGSVLLADFDDIDKHLADAGQLFANITELKRIDTIDYLSPEQIEHLQHFFSGFSTDRHSELKERFLRLWDKMADIYTSWHDLMRQRGMMTEGAMFRDVVENRYYLDRDTQLTYVFVGFNVLDTVEERLMLRLQQAKRAIFFWDYDVSYVNDPQSEAGRFMRSNLALFPTPLGAEHFDNLRHLENVTFVAAGGETVQANYVKTWIRNLKNPTSTSNAVVLCNESLLHPVLHSIPGKDDGGPEVANITMGYPVSHTSVASYLTTLLDLQTAGWDKARQRFMSRAKRLVSGHPLYHGDPFTHCSNASELLDYLRHQLTTIPAGDDPLTRETVFRLYTTLTRLQDMADNGELQVSTATLQRIIVQSLATITVPFHGEPAVGLQVMGVLETRCLDFKNLLMLSVGEGYMPQNPASNSFIPHFLRTAFGLTTIEHKVAVQAYYFYRLLMRAENVTCVYSTAATDGAKNEMSRFLRQILADTAIPVKMLSLAPDMTLQRSSSPLTVEKTPEVMQRVRAQIHRLAPTAINTYIQCQLQFFLHYVANLRESDEPDADVIDSAMFGTIFHNSAQEVYTRIGHSHITASDLERYIGPDGEPTEQSRALLRQIVEERFHEDYFSKLPDPTASYTGQMLIQRDVLVSYLELTLQHDLRLTPFDMIAMEQWYTVPITIDDGTVIETGGKIDRLDIVHIDGNETVRVVDYKTGTYDAKKLAVDDFDTLFATGGYALQTFIYALAVCLQGETRPVVPALFFIQQAANPDYSPLLSLRGADRKRQVIHDFHPLTQETGQHLRYIINSIFDPAVPFTAAPIGSEACRWCPFVNIFGR